MNREHKYRIWDSKTNTMIENEESYYLLSRDGVLCVYQDDDGGKSGLWEHNVEVEKDRFIVEFFTGLLDKNGLTEIYENDSLQIGKCPLHATVFWNNEVAAWQVTNPHTEDGGAPLLSQYANDYHNIATVIGTIHDAPEKESSHD